MAAKKMAVRKVCHKCRKEEGAVVMMCWQSLRIDDFLFGKLVGWK